MSNRSMDNAFFSNRVNSWLNDRRERTEFNIQIMGSIKGKNFLAFKCFSMRLFFPTIPKPLKQYTLFKKDDPFRSYACVHGRAFPCNDIGGVASSFH